MERVRYSTICRLYLKWLAMKTKESGRELTNADIPGHEFVMWLEKYLDN